MSTKSNLLKALEKNKGHFVSGQELAEILKVSRTSVWKAVKDLQQSGYNIEAITNKGYKLATESSILSEEAISGYVDKGIEISEIIVLKTVDSTNNEAKRLIMTGERFGTVIFAEEQTMGKGRMGRNFLSPSGDSVYVSFILKPLLDVRDSLLVTVGASVAVARAIEKINDIDAGGIIPQIKWVNDVYLDGKKVCGILTEAVSDVESGQIQSLILGIGININMQAKDYPKEIRETAGSLKLAPGQRNEFGGILINEISHIQNEIKKFSSSENKEPSFMKEYRQKSMIIGKEIFVIKGNEKLEAEAIDIDHRGGLLVKYKTGETELLNTGEISIRLNS